MKYTSKKNIRHNRKSLKNIKKPINNIKRIINIYGGKPPIRNEHFIIYKTEEDFPEGFAEDFGEEVCGGCLSNLFDPVIDPDANDNNRMSSNWIIQLHPSVQAQAPHLFHYNCVSSFFQQRTIVNGQIQNVGLCPTCRFEIPTNAVQEILQEGGINIPIRYQQLPYYNYYDDDNDNGHQQYDEDDEDDVHIEWGRRAWDTYQKRLHDHEDPLFYANIGNYIPPPVGEIIMERDIPEGCSFIPPIPNPWGHEKNGRCARTNAEFNNPYKCSVSRSNRCILKKPSHRPVGCKLIKGNNNNRCIPTEEGEIDDQDNCIISNHNRCILNPIRKVIPQGCVAVPIVYGPNLTYKCKRTRNAAHNQPDYCEVNALANCQKKSKTYRKR